MCYVGVYDVCTTIITTPKSVSSDIYFFLRNKHLHNIYVSFWISNFVFYWVFFSTKREKIRRGGRTKWERLLSSTDRIHPSRPEREEDTVRVFFFHEKTLSFELDLHNKSIRLLSRQCLYKQILNNNGSYDLWRDDLI